MRRYKNSKGLFLLRGVALPFGVFFYWYNRWLCSIRGYGHQGRRPSRIVRGVRQAGEAAVPPGALVAGVFHQGWAGRARQEKSARDRIVAYPPALLTENREALSTLCRSRRQKPSRR
jgi:hypothetical protein